VHVAIASELSRDIVPDREISTHTMPNGVRNGPRNRSASIQRPRRRRTIRSVVCRQKQECRNPGAGLARKAAGPIYYGAFGAGDRLRHGTLHALDANERLGRCKARHLRIDAAGGPPPWRTARLAGRRTSFPVHLNSVPGGPEPMGGKCGIGPAKTITATVNATPAPTPKARPAPPKLQSRPAPALARNDATPSTR
jgi:hypothetical protein